MNMCAHTQIFKCTYIIYKYIFKTGIFTRNVYSHSLPSPLPYIPGERREPRMSFVNRRVRYEQRTRSANLGCRLIHGPRELWTSKPAHKCVPYACIFCYICAWAIWNYKPKTPNPVHSLSNVQWVPHPCPYPSLLEKYKKLKTTPYFFQRNKYQ